MILSFCWSGSDDRGIIYIFSQFSHFSCCFAKHNCFLVCRSLSFFYIYIILSPVVLCKKRGKEIIVEKEGERGRERYEERQRERERERVGGRRKRVKEEDGEIERERERKRKRKREREK